VSGERFQDFMLHLGQVPQAVRRDVETVSHDRQTRLNQIVLRVLGMIAKLTPQTSEHQFEVRVIRKRMRAIFAMARGRIL
jgi:hypothetical protein